MNLKLSKANLIREVKDYFFISFGLFCYALGFGVIGIWYGVVLDQFTRFVLTQWRFKSEKWMKIKI